MAISPLSISQLMMGAVPCEGFRSVRAPLQFNTLGVTSIDADLTYFNEQNLFESIQTIYLDNQSNNAIVNITISGSLQVIPFPALSAGFVNVFAPANASINFSTTGNVDLTAFLLNFYFPGHIWSAPNTVNLTPSRGALTNRSGTISVGGTSEVLAAANATRSYLLIQNPSTAAGQGIATAESLYINFGAAAGIDDGTSFELTPGGSLELQGPFISSDSINVNATTINHAWIAREG
jgi:hypothetical protein